MKTFIFSFVDFLHFHMKCVIFQSEHCTAVYSITVEDFTAVGCFYWANNFIFVQDNKQKQ